MFGLGKWKAPSERTIKESFTLFLRQLALMLLVFVFFCLVLFILVLVENVPSIF